MKRIRLTDKTPAPILSGVRITDFNGGKLAGLKEGYNAIIDTGSSHTVVPLEAASIAGTPTGLEVHATGFTGESISCPEYLIQLYHIEFGVMPVRALGQPKRKQILLGRDVLAGEFCEPMTLVIDWKTKEWSFGSSSPITSVIVEMLAYLLKRCQKK